MCGLCLYRHLTVLIKKCSLEFIHNLIVKICVFLHIFLTAQNFGCFYKQSCGICKISRTGQIIRCCTEIAAFLSIQSYPVTELQLVVPDIIYRIFSHKVDPVLHAVVLDLQNLFVTKRQIHGPWIDHSHICPGCCRMTSLLKEPVVPFISGNNIRNNMGNTALLCLICLHIAEPFPIEGIGIFKEACSTAENLRVSGPAKSLISLRAVCRNIHKVTLQSPEDIVGQLVQIRIGCLKKSGTFHVGMNGMCDKVSRFRCSREENDLCVTESHKGKGRTVSNGSIFSECILKRFFCPS